VRISGEDPVDRVVRVLDTFINHLSHSRYGWLIPYFYPQLKEWLVNPPPGEEGLRDRLVRDFLEAFER